MPSVPVRVKFTKHEDRLLQKHVKQLGEDNWAQISTFFPSRTIRQLRERYMFYLSPGLNHNPWTPEEDQLLLKQVEELGHSWTKITFLFPGRTTINLKNRYRTLIRRNVKQMQDEKPPTDEISSGKTVMEEAIFSIQDKDLIALLLSDT